MQRIKKENYIMDEKDSLSEYNKIPPGHNCTNGAVLQFYSQINFKVGFTLHFRYSIVIRRFISALILLNPNNHYNHVFPNTFDYNHYVYSDNLVCSVAAIAHIIRI